MHQKPKEQLPAYSEDEVRARLVADLPHWKLEDGAIQRVYRTSGWKSTLLVANTVGHLAEAAWHHPELCLTYYAVTIKLRTRKADGVTERDLALARKIEEVIGWQPAKEQSPFRGTPNEKAQYKYLDYDEISSSI